MDSETAAARRGLLRSGLALVVVFVVTALPQLPGGLLPDWLTAYRGIPSTLWPQGWSYFDDVPRAEVLVTRRIELDGSLVRATSPLMSEENRWGLSRISYARYREAQVVAAQVPGAQWVSCDGMARDECLARPNRGHAVQVRTAFLHPSLCGPLLLAFEQPAHWTSGRAPDDVPRTVRRTAVADVRCES